MTLSSVVRSLSSVSTALPGGIKMRKHGLVTDFQGYVPGSIVVVYIDFCKEEGGWCNVPWEYLLNAFEKIDGLESYAVRTKEALLESGLSSLRITGRFNFDKKRTLWITEIGVDYLNKNYFNKGTLWTTEVMVDYLISYP